MQNMLLVCQESVLFFSPTAPEAIYFRSRFAKKRQNYSWKEVSSSHAVKLKDKHIQEIEEDRETSSSAKRVTQVKSAVGHKASTVIWEVNFNQIFPEFGLNMSFIWAPNWGLSRRTNTANFSVGCVCGHPSLPVLHQKHFLLCVRVWRLMFSQPEMFACFSVDLILPCSAVVCARARRGHEAAPRDQKGHD